MLFHSCHDFPEKKQHEMKVLSGKFGFFLHLGGFLWATSYIEVCVSILSWVVFKSHSFN